MGKTEAPKFSTEQQEDTAATAYYHKGKLPVFLKYYIEHEGYSQQRLPLPEDSGLTGFRIKLAKNNRYNLIDVLANGEYHYLGQDSEGEVVIVEKAMDRIYRSLPTEINLARIISFPFELSA